MRIMVNKVREYVKEQHMFEKGDYVVAGVSGGADSICLLCMLMELQEEYELKLHVVHVNHGIRKEAGQDADYVEQFCKEHRIPFTLIEEKVEELAARWHISTEEAGREVRYEAFYRTLNENKGERNGKIAIAHNKNDCCETFLFHLFRGSGLRGLTGIQAVRGEIVRPLLCLERTEIEQYLEEKHISYCIDRTNLEDNYTRNRIRHHILQTACDEVSQGAVSHVKEACDKINDAYELITDLTKQGYDSCVRLDEKGYHILKEPFEALHKTLQSYCLMEVLAKAAGSRKDLESVHTIQLTELMEKQCGRHLDLPYGLEAVREYEGIRLVSKSAKKENKRSKPESICGCIGEEEKERLNHGDTVTIEMEEGTLSCSLLCRKDVQGKEIPQKTYTKWLDYDKIKGDIVVRNRRPGDYLTVNSKNQRKLLKAYFIDEKVPREDRDHVYLVTEGSHCIWIIGSRISSCYKVSEDTSHILEIKYLRRSQ